ncbi:S1C family serine protease [Nocardioides jishulii]|uniref:PDZ domain-containing protein n=1 Tax=Nocardioides jishulii TaxID=2575440 RepID=A0A4U2YTA9_9ACTN|nr:trypsin-like peptidase domain-containing protein [Nocardioides jishulii]QCX28379.1 PDZ domain-containing protein [Nocardioides jishulii]TKI64728.1 PDZ domain-containing protein [Nocardioides jishulii]
MSNEPNSPNDPSDPRDPSGRPVPPATFYGQGGSSDPSSPPGSASAQGGGPSSPPPPPPTAPEKKARQAGAGIAVASLVLGLLGGVGGAAAYDRWGDDDSTSSSRNTSKVVDQGRSSADDGTVEGVAARVLPSVVRIDVASEQAAGSGSGIILSSDGQILTNEHVVAGAGEGASLRVSFDDGTRADAKVLGTDPLTDTALIQAEGVTDLTPATIGKSSNLQVGQQVVAIGSPFGLDATVTSGIISALNRPVNVGTADNQGNSTTYPAIQTDAAINPGNSGGPLVDMTGSVVGINSSIRTASSGSGQESGSIGLGFAIPIDEILPIIDQMKEGEKPTHARLGIRVSDTEGTDSDTVGALVREVNQDAAAEAAGLKPGDVITKIDDKPIDGADALVATVRSFRPGDEVKVTFVRDGKERTVDLKLGSDADE